MELGMYITYKYNICTEYKFYNLGSKVKGRQILQWFSIIAAPMILTNHSLIAECLPLLFGIFHSIQ
jgi:hypothetical protein